MSARRDDNPPDEWADKVTDLPDNSGKKDGEIGSSFTVTDRRHWAEGEESDEDMEIPALKQPAYVKALEDELREKDETLQQYITQYKSAKSEMNEAIGRIEREKEREISFRIADLAKAFLSVIDDLSAATEAAAKCDDVSTIREGLDLIAQRIGATLGDIDITPIDAIGKPLDPNEHEAVAIESVNDPAKDGMIIGELKKGYKLGDVLVRPSSVVVGKYEK